MKKGKAGSKVVAFSKDSERLREENRRLRARIRKLKESESSWRRIIDGALEGFFQSDAEGHFIRANQAMAKILGYDSAEELIKSSEPLASTLYVEPGKREEYKKMMQEKGEVRGFLFQARRRDGTTCWLLENARAITDRKGKLLYYEGYVQDVTNAKKTAENLMETKAQLESLIHAAADLIYFKDKNGKYVIVNKAFEQMFALAREKILGKNDAEILPADLALQCIASDAAALRELRPTTIEETLVTSNGKKVVFETIKAPVFGPDSSLVGLVGISRDITQRKKTEEELRNLVQEKEILLREIHHRVKNNMQVISSLLSLQAQKLTDNQAVQALKECQERIRSMALVHDKLYQQQAFHRIEFSSYLRTLATHLFHAYQIDSRLIRLRVEAEEIHLNLNTAIPCGLIVNELITNALKHAFAPGQGGEIVVGLSRTEGGQLLLTVKDNGRGLPADFNINQSPSLGLEIVNILVNQLGGSLKVATAAGTEFQVIFAEQNSSSYNG